MSEEKKSYDLDLVCLNCKNEFSQTIPFGLDFHPETWSQPAHYGAFGAYQSVSCPKCGSGRIDRKHEEEKA